MTTGRTVEPRTAAGKFLAGWLGVMRDRQYLDVPDPALVSQIEAEAALATEAGALRELDIDFLAQALDPAAWAMLRPDSPSSAFAAREIRRQEARHRAAQVKNEYAYLVAALNDDSPVAEGFCGCDLGTNDSILCPACGHLDHADFRCAVRLEDPAR